MLFVLLARCRVGTPRLPHPISVNRNLFAFSCAFVAFVDHSHFIPPPLAFILHLVNCHSHDEMLLAKSMVPAYVHAANQR